MHVMLTGATGLLGSRTLLLLRDRAEVTCLGRSRPDESWVRFIEGDLSSAVDLLEVGPVDCVVHLAQSLHYRDFPRRATDVLAVNVTATGLLLDFARSVGAARFIYASTGGLYLPSRDPISEESNVRGLGELSYYFATKLAGEALVRSYEGLLDTHILRPFFIYGPGQRAELLVSRIAKDIRESEAILVPSPQDIHINPIWVGDAAEATTRLALSGGPSTLNLAGPTVTSISELACMVGDLVGRAPILLRGEEGTDIVGSSEQLEHYLGRPLTPLAIGLQMMFDQGNR